jgi:triacylglycerol esterase/lipase EstA (alpha/beta hydrolase family)
MQNSNFLQHIPDDPDRTRKYLFYLHGLIVEEAGIRPKSEEHGYYEYELIVNELSQKRFIVISEVREKGTEIIAYAEKIAAQVRRLLNSGVPPQNIAIVGASKGGIITAYVSSMLKNKEINYLFLAGLFEKCLQDPNLQLYGNVLSLHDRSDKLSMTPALYFQRSEGSGKFREIVLNLDVGHGLIYRPYREWLDPLWSWLHEARV